MDNRFDIYIRALAAAYRDEGTEHTGRTALENLLNAFAAETLDRGTLVQQEAGREGDKGAPDFKVKRKGMILGYVEVKEIGANLDKVLKSDQIARYRKLSDNIVVTDYLQFIRIDAAGRVIARETLSYPSDLESRRIHVNPERADAVKKLLDGFFSSPEVGLSDAKKLAEALAARSRLLRDDLTDELIRQEKAKDEGRLHDLLDVFRDQVFHELTIKEFADAFAQMLAYGLFLAKLSAGERDVIQLDNVRRFIPGSFRLIRELVRFLEELQESEYAATEWVVDEILSIVNGLRIEEIRDDLSFRRRKTVSRKVRAGDEEEHRLFERDPFIYFYEDFLKAYDKETQKARGVYYTPPPVVNFIVRAVDDILKDTFKITDGLADNDRVTVLDFAAGTGTFLLEVMQRIFDNIGGPEKGKAGAIVREHMLKNLYGFEYLIAPYTIAHVKLSQYLKDKGHPLEDDERLQVFLTNTLEPVAPQKNAFLPQLSAEVEAAQSVKEQPILVILGNPPYKGHSKNKGKWITRAIDGYKYTFERSQSGTNPGGAPIYTDVAKPLGERNPKWLNDDYVKFIRFAQLKMDGYSHSVLGPDGKQKTVDVPGVEAGVVGVITNHSWLDNPTFRGMRQSLLRSFDQIYLVDLHGSTKPKEPAPEGLENENVFDIQKGVAVAVFVKKPGVDKGIWHTDIWGNRLAKYQRCAESELRGIAWSSPKAFTPYYMFSPIDWTGWDAYGGWWQIADSLNPSVEKRQIFSVNVLGFQTHRDKFAVAFGRKEVERRVQDMLDVSLSDQVLKDRYSIADNRDWKISDARSALRQRPQPNVAIIDCAFRPFDNRPCYFGGEFMDYPRRELLDHVAGRENLQLLVSRQIGTDYWRHSFVAAHPAESCLISDGSTEQNYCFPIRLFDNAARSHENLSPDFRAFLDDRYDHHYSPEEILGYIYSVLHAATYRKRYAAFLRIDFPRIPFPEKAGCFEALSKLGWGLVQVHLMRDLLRRGLADFEGKGENTIEHVRWSGEDERISINKTQGFAPVPGDVWNFHIGGHQVIDKYLKERKGHVLSLDEINQIGRIADALAFTIDQMALIDAAYQQAFPFRG